MFILKVKFKFSASHLLPEYKGECEKLHGHTWKGEIAVEGNTLRNGMLIDFKDIKAIIRKFDHSHLNTIIYMPTAENLAKKIYEEVEKKAKVKYVELWESEDCGVKYTGGEG
jgi:6-pyruvoyltetrahydropterin/6-carboxytetrahydropterin synthase